MPLDWMLGRKSTDSRPRQIDSESARHYISALYRNLLRREPSSKEAEPWVKFLLDGNPAEKVFYSFVGSEEYKSKCKVSTLYPAGHYHSPVVDPHTVGNYVAAERGNAGSTMAGISLPLEDMVNFWKRSSRLIADTPFKDAPSTDRRFHYNNIFPYGDAIGLRAMIADLRPKSVIEVGSGYSSACMLDSADEFGLDTQFTFIDPYPERLKQLLRKEDLDRATIIESPVQETALSLYASLNAGDILFIDSTHVLKTGSDVHFELFHILPILRSGVVVHFHDIQYPFEYPDQWIFEDNYSWNEIYALRAFLMYNTDFRIRFWGSFLAHERKDLIRDVQPLFLKNPGGSIWIDRV
jgi:predicted O-methyltransferase YrrM